MTTDLSRYNANELPSADVLKRQRYAIIVADWNSEITHAMAKGAIDTFVKNGVKEDHIDVYHVPGTVELVYAAGRLIPQVVNNTMRCKYDAIIVIGCVIQGDTPHFDYVCQSVTQGVSRLNSLGIVPVIFSVMTTLDKQQALDRAGGRLGNKGVEGAVTAMRMTML